MVLGVSDDPEALTGLTWRVLVSCGPIIPAVTP